MTSTSTPGSMMMLAIFFIISDGEYRSITLLWMRIWKRSHVLDPSPHGVFRVVIRKILVGIRTGPLTFNFCFLALPSNSEHTEIVRISVKKLNWLIEVQIVYRCTLFHLPFSSERTLREVRVILIRCIGATSCPGFSGFSVFKLACSEAIKTIFLFF